MITLNFISADIIDLQKISTINNGKIPILEGKELILMPCTFNGISIVELFNTFIYEKNQVNFNNSCYISFLNKKDFDKVENLIKVVGQGAVYYTIKNRETGNSIPYCSIVHCGISFSFYQNN